MLEFLIGTACAVYLWKTFIQWQQARREAEYVRKALAPYGGLGVGVERVVREPVNFNSTSDVLWGTAAVIAPIVFALAVVVRIFH